MSDMYNRGMLKLSDNTVDWTGSTVVGVMLVSSGYTFSADHNVIGDIDNELTGTGYVAGGKELTGRTITEDDANNQVELDAADVVWSSISAGTAAAAIFYESGGTNSLIGYVDSDFPVTTNGGDLTVQRNPDGILKYSTTG